MGWAPGLMPLVAVTPEDYQRMLGRMEPSQWPVYFGARMAANVIQNIGFQLLQQYSIDELRRNLPTMLVSGLDVAADQAAAGPTGDAGELFYDLKRLYEGLYHNWVAGIWEGMGAAYSSAMDDLLNVGQLLYGYKTLAYHIAITPRMRRHWNKTFHPMIPDGHMAWVLYRRGDFTRTQFDEHVAYEGWDKAGADLLTKSMQAIPSPREAFYLWTKGLIDFTKRDSLYFAAGFDTLWHTIMTENFYYTPSLYDMTRIADYVELDQIWAVDTLKRRGMRERDIAKMWEMLKVRPLRDEITKLTTKALYCRQHGYWDHDRLDSFWGEMVGAGYIKNTERGLLNEYGDISYEVEVLEEQIEILRWRFRTARITKEEFLENLLTLDVEEVKANLIVELEIAKGYFGYIYPGAT